MAFSIKHRIASFMLPWKYGLTIFWANSFSISAEKLWKVKETSKSLSRTVSERAIIFHWKRSYLHFPFKATAQATRRIWGEVS
jgi:hypothetical protein